MARPLLRSIAPGPKAGLLLGLTLLLGGCTVLPWYRVPDDAFARDTVHVACCVRPGATLEATYLGVGGWLFRAGDAAVLAAPLYSNPGLLETGLTTIASDPDAVARHLPDVSDVAVVLVGHGHYDHLMDVPVVMERHAPEALLVANRTSFLQVEPFGFAERPLVPSGPGEVAPAPLPDAPGHEGAPERPGRVLVVDDSLAGDDVRDGRWIRVGPRVRVMPLVSDHAPHLAGITLYDGERTTPMPRPPVSAEEWLEGRSYAFLVDLLGDDGRRLARIYYQDAVPAAPYGMVPPAGEDSVDVAVLVPATYAEVDWHPEAFVDDARPGHVLLGHWENFFRPPRAEPEPVPFTLLADFRRRLERAMAGRGGWHLPLPGTVFVFR